MTLDASALFENMPIFCPVCNRKLKSTKSIVRGIGPVCAKKQQEKDANDQLDLELETNEIYKTLTE